MPGLWPGGVENRVGGVGAGRGNRAVVRVAWWGWGVDMGGGWRFVVGRSIPARIIHLTPLSLVIATMKFGDAPQGRKAPLQKQP